MPPETAIYDPPNSSINIFKKFRKARSRLNEADFCKLTLIFQDLGASKSFAHVCTALPSEIRHFLSKMCVAIFLDIISPSCLQFRVEFVDFRSDFDVEE